MFWSFFIKGKPTSSIHQFKVKTLSGQWLDLSDFKGKKMLIVNTASNCSFSGQYKELEKLYTTYKDKNFVVLGFPCNQFKGQEPGSSAEIHDFCERNYGVTFPMMEKIDVKGKQISEVYSWLTQKRKNGVQSSFVKWNFQKYMINEEGHLLGSVTTLQSPDCSKIINWIEG